MGPVDGGSVDQDRKVMGSAVGPSIRCWPMTTPASGAAVWSTIVTIATACGVSGLVSWYVNEPVTEVFAARSGTASAALTNATNAARRTDRWRRGDRTVDLSAGGGDTSSASPASLKPSSHRPARASGARRRERFRSRVLARPAGLEPTTFRSATCLYPLSYGRTVPSAAGGEGRDSNPRAGYPKWRFSKPLH